ncbi:sensor histidine kinase [Parapedobacter sp. 2B3]|uniref:sensor histidine kinase n=1 Tax=Parapedobacter sp. 2B3 TaxID=3342381 RepID=UPI0035B5B3D7
MITYFFIAGGAALLTVGCCWWYFRKQTTHISLMHQQRVSELEDMAWRAQMNPHFLNNCLNSINAIISQHDKPLATHYLTSLSRLTRNVLEYSQEATITLADELDLVTQYLTLERLRFGEDLLINISLASDIDTEKIWIPPLVLQPFVENAIIHGLLPRQAKGTIDLGITAQDAVLCCTIADDGVGRKIASDTADRTGAAKRSLGIAITQKRIALFNTSHRLTLPFAIRDLTDPNGTVKGTAVDLQFALVKDAG